MVKFANDHGAQVIAEGVERAEEFDTVKALGVHLVQGFYLHRPGAPLGGSNGTGSASVATPISGSPVRGA